MKSNRTCKTSAETDHDNLNAVSTEKKSRGNQAFLQYYDALTRIKREQFWFFFQDWKVTSVPTETRFINGLHFSKSRVKQYWSLLDPDAFMQEVGEYCFSFFSHLRTFQHLQLCNNASKFLDSSFSSLLHDSKSCRNLKVTNIRENLLN